MKRMDNPPVSGIFMELDHLTEADMRWCLAQALERPWSVPQADSSYPLDLLKGPPRPAAVLMPLLRQEETWHILLTRRIDGLPEHSGQVAFPGGRADPEDASLEDTALREAWEEIGLCPADVHLLGRMGSYLTITNYRVTPVVGVMPWPYALRLEQAEVSKAFIVPLTWLADPANYEERPRILPPPHAPMPVVYFKSYAGEILWGASARFMLAFLGILRDFSTGAAG